MHLLKAEQIANDLKERIATYCVIAAVAGSVRRRKHDVKDIEILCIPVEHEIESGLFGNFVSQRDRDFVMEAMRFGKNVKGDLVKGKYCQFYNEDYGVYIDLFMCSIYNWGYQYMLRTGPREFSTSMTVKARHCGIRFKDGYVWDRLGNVLIVQDEKRLFELLGIDWIEPSKRER